MPRPSLPAIYSGVILALLTLGAFALEILLTSQRGPGISTDAVQYIAAADSLARGHGLLTFTGAPFINFGPLYPVILAIPAAILGVDPILAARAFNALTLSLIVILTALLAWEMLPSSRIWGILAALSILLSPGFLILSANVFSDPLFIGLTLLFLLIIRRYARSLNPWLLVAAGLTCSLATLARYIGGTLIVVGAVTILYLHRQSPRKAIFISFLFSFLSAVPIAVWFIRNALLVGRPFGYRNPAEMLPGQNLADLVKKVSHWFIPDEMAPWAILLIILLLVTALVLWRRSKFLKTGLTSSRPERTSAALLAGFIFLYSLALLFSIETPEHNTLAYDDRYYLPIYVPLLVLLGVLLNGLLHAINLPSKIRRPENLLLLLFALWLVVPAVFSARLVRRTVARGYVPFYNIYQSPQYLDSEVTGWLKKGLVDGEELVYSNQAAAAYLSLRRSVQPSPVNRDRYGNPVPLEAYAGQWPDLGPSLLIWYEIPKDTVYPLDALSSLAHLIPLRTSKAGGIFRVQPHSNP